MNITFDNINQKITDSFQAFRNDEVTFEEIDPNTGSVLGENNPIKFNRNTDVGLLLDKYSVLVISGVNALGNKNSRKIQEFLVSCISGEYILQERANGDLEAIFSGDLDIYGMKWPESKPDRLELSNGNYQHVLANKPIGQLQLFSGDQYHVPLVPNGMLRVASWKELRENPVTFNLGKCVASNKPVLKRKLTIQLTNEQLEKLELLAKQEKTSKPEIIRRLIEKA